MHTARWLVGISSGLVMALACGGDGSDTGGIGTTEGGSPTGPGDGGTTDGGSESTRPAVLTVLSDPCQGAGTPHALTFSSSDRGWVGCGNGIGLWQTEDGGATFVQAHPSNSLYAYKVVEEDDGDLLLCGHDYEHDDGALLMRRSGEEWSTLLRYGNNASDSTAVYMSNCGAMAQPAAGRHVVASLTAGDITVSEDDGATWAEEERYWEDDNFDGYSYYYLLGATAVGGSWFAAGSKIDEPPVFFSQSTDDRAEWWNMNATVIDASIIGEVWALATSDDGATWFAGGRDQDQTSSASGFIYRSTDGGQTWSGGKSTLADLSNGEIDVVHDIAFADDGLNGIAVGHRYPPATKGGFVIWTRDGGDTWHALEEEVEILQSAAISGDTFWVAGDGFLARGLLSELTVD